MMRNILFPIFFTCCIFLLTLHSQADEGLLNGSRDLALGATEYKMVSAGRNIDLNGTIILGSVTAGRSVNGINCRIDNMLSAGRDVNLQNCSHIYSVTAGRSLNIANSNVADNITSGSSLALVNSSIHGDVFAGGGIAKLEGSKINGTLSMSGAVLTLNSSTLNNIHLKKPFYTDANNVISLSHGVIGYGNSVTVGSNNLIVNRGNNYTTVTLGPGSLSNLNGYTIRSIIDKTTLQTPDGTVYINGEKVAGEGPKHYADYRTRHINAPFITAPGWPAIQKAAKYGENYATSENLTLQSIELVNNSTITGKVTFESGKGKIVVHPGSKFTGAVEGGTVEHL